MKCSNNECGHKLRFKIEGTPERPIAKVIGHTLGFRKGRCGVKTEAFGKSCKCTKYPPYEKKI